MVMRGAKRKGVRYFGPYAHAWAIRETVDLLLRVFPMRTCRDGVFKRAGQIGRPCLLGYIGKCAAPCVGRVTAEEHRADRRRLLRVHGRPDRRLHQAPRAARCARRPTTQDYERAARLRDDIGALHRRSRSRPSCSATAPTPTSSRSPTTRSRPRCRSSTCAAAGCAASAAGSSTRSRSVDPPSSSSSSCMQLYGGDDAPTAIPREVLVPGAARRRRGASTSWLSERRGVHGRDPGARSAATSARCMETVARNAQQALALHKTRARRRPHRPQPGARGDPGGARAPEAPLRIECYDVSNLQGTEIVASMVVFEDGLPRKREYRRFTIRDVDGPERRRARWTR